MIREMKNSDWERVAEIYTQGLESGNATFNVVCPSFEEWDSAHNKDCRFVAVEDGKVVGWLAVGPTSRMHAYWGVVEVSIYLDNDYCGRGIGTALIKKVIEEAPKCGYWTLYSAIIAHNSASIATHKKCGFRTVGRRERIAQDKFGIWQDTIIMELRLD